MAKFFSQASTRRLEPVIHKTIDILTDALKTHAGSGKPVTVSSAYSGFAIDVISDYCFAKSFNVLEDTNFEHSMHAAFSKARAGMHFLRHFPWLMKIFKKLPRYDGFPQV